MHSMPLGPMSKHLKDLSPRSLHFSVPRAYRSLAHAMSATRHNLAALVDEQERSQVGQKKPIRVAESDMPTASGNKVLVRILARPVNPSGHCNNILPLIGVVFASFDAWSRANYLFDEVGKFSNGFRQISPRFTS